MFDLFKIAQNKYLKKSDKIQNHKVSTSHIPKKHVNYFFCCPNRLRHWTLLYFIIPSYSPLEKTDFPFLVGLNQTYLLFKIWESVFTWSLSTRAPCSLNLCKCCVFCHSLCKLICASVPLCLEDTISIFFSFDKFCHEWIYSFLCA